jgi:hypothetical protein
MIVGGIVLAGCGGSGQVMPGTVTEPSQPIFHSATKHYSVHQVEQVFAAQGIRLRSVTPQAYGGITALLDGRPAHTVYVYVTLGKFTGALKQPVHGAGVMRHGNVEAFWRGADRAPVRSALRELD